MSLRQTAELIPQEYRREMLELNLIDSAKAVAGDKSMHYLTVIWKNYIEHDFEPECNLCLSRVLKNMQQMKDTFVKLEKDHQLLKNV